MEAINEAICLGRERDHTKACVPANTIFWQTRNPIRALEHLLPPFTSAHLNAVGGRLRCISWKCRILRNSFQVCFIENNDLCSTRSKGWMRNNVCCHSSVGTQIQGAGKAGTPQNSLFASGISFHLRSGTSEAEGSWGAVFSVLG